MIKLEAPQSIYYSATLIAGNKKMFLDFEAGIIKFDGTPEEAYKTFIKTIDTIKAGCKYEARNEIKEAILDLFEENEEPD